MLPTSVFQRILTSRHLKLKRGGAEAEWSNLKRKSTKTKRFQIRPPAWAIFKQLFKKSFSKKMLIKIFLCQKADLNGQKDFLKFQRPTTIIFYSEQELFNGFVTSLSYSLTLAGTFWTDTHSLSVSQSLTHITPVHTPTHTLYLWVSHTIYHLHTHTLIYTHILSFTHPHSLFDTPTHSLSFTHALDLSLTLARSRCTLLSQPCTESTLSQRKHRSCCWRLTFSPTTTLTRTANLLDSSQKSLQVANSTYQPWLKNILRLLVMKRLLNVDACLSFPPIDLDEMIR